jgi:hypothetical protein
MKTYINFLLESTNYMGLPSFYEMGNYKSEKEALEGMLEYIEQFPEAAYKYAGTVVTDGFKITGNISFKEQIEKFEDAKERERMDGMSQRQLRSVYYEGWDE